jgi:DNA-binding beta-propeller fold protein YncE
MKIALSHALRISAVTILLSFFLSAPALAAPRIIAHVTIPSNAAAGGPVVNEALNKIYTSGGASGGQVVAIIDGSTFGVTTGGTGSGAGVDTATNRYWAGGVYDGEAHVYDGISNQTLAIPNVGYCPISAYIDPVKRYVWVAAQCGGGSDPVWAVNADTYAVVHGPIGTGGTMGSLIANSATGRAYIGPSSVSKRINPTTFAVTATSFGIVLGVNPKTNRLYAWSGTNYQNLQVIDGAPDPEAILTTVPLTFNGAIGIDTKRNQVYITNGGGNCLQIMDGQTNTLGGTIPLGTGVSPYGVAVDSTRNRIYVLASTSGGAVLYVIQGNTALAGADMLLSE